MWDADWDSRERVTGVRKEAGRPSLGMAEQEMEGARGGGKGACGWQGEV